MAFICNSTRCNTACSHYRYDQNSREYCCFAKVDLKSLVGKTIRIIKMDGEPNYENRRGVVTEVDGMFQLHGTWGGLAVIDRLDEYVVEEEV